MTNKEILELFNGLSMCGELRGIKFSYAVAKNANNLRPIIETIQKQIKELQTKHVKKDKDDKPIVKDNKIEMEDMKKFNKEYEELLAIDNNDIKLHKIKEADLPENISPKELTSIMSIVE